MTNVVKFKAKDWYPVEIKIVDGKEVEIVDIDALTEAQWKKYCRDTGTEYFNRWNGDVRWR